MAGNAEEVQKVAAEIAAADRLLIIGAAGLSISLDLPNNVYHSDSDFARHYPEVVKYGYRNGFMAMGIHGDQRVPLGVRKAFQAHNFLNMRYMFPPTPAYNWLKQLADTYGPEDTFTWTSNADGNFERVGFNVDRIYTPQGCMTHMQCMDCNEVFPCEDQVRAIVAASPDGILQDESLMVKCPKCGKRNIMPNLRGGDWFMHYPFLPVQERLLEWLDDSVNSQKTVAVIEVGVGGNTPIVTRIPAVAWAEAVAAGGGRAVYLRVNKDRPEPLPENPRGERVSFYRFQDDWTVLEPVVKAAVDLRADKEKAASIAVDISSGTADPDSKQKWQGKYQAILMSLRR